MNEIIKFIHKEKQKKYLEIFLILDEIGSKEDIISFTYSDNILVIRTGINDYYRINFEEVK